MTPRHPDVTFVHITGPAKAGTTDRDGDQSQVTTVSAPTHADAFMAALDTFCYPDTAPEIGATMRAAIKHLPRTTGAEPTLNLEDQRVNLPYPSGRPRVIAARSDAGWHVAAYPDRTGADPYNDIAAVNDDDLAKEVEGAYASTVPVVDEPSAYAWNLNDVTEETGLLDPPIREGNAETFEVAVTQAEAARRDAARDAQVTVTAREYVPHLPSGKHESTNTYGDGTRLHLFVHPLD